MLYQWEKFHPPNFSPQDEEVFNLKMRDIYDLCSEHKAGFDLKMRHVLAPVVRCRLLVCHAEQVSVEVVQVCGLVATRVAPPGVALGVEALVEEVEGLVGVGDVAMLAGMAR